MSDDLSKAHDELLDSQRVSFLDLDQSYAINGSDKLLVNLLVRINGVLPVYSINKHQWKTRLLLTRINQW